MTGSTMKLIDNQGKNKTIQAALDKVHKEAAVLQEVSSASLHDLDAEIEETREELDIKGTALEILKQRVKAEISEFRQSIAQQVDALSQEFAEKIAAMKQEIAAKEGEWEMWKSSARSSRDAFSKGMADNEKNVTLYENKVRELRTQRDTLTNSLRARLRHLNMQLDDDYRKEISAQGQLETEALNRLSRMKDQVDTNLQEADMKWEQQCEHIDAVFGEIATAVYNRRERG